MLVAGRARLEFESAPDPVEMKPGDWVRIPAHGRHRVAWTEPDVETIWLAVFYQR